MSLTHVKTEVSVQIWARGSRVNVYLAFPAKTVLKVSTLCYVCITVTMKNISILYVLITCLCDLNKNLNKIIIFNELGVSFAFIQISLNLVIYLVQELP